jgi:hypothetical protein
METGSRAKQPFLIADSSGLISLTSHTDRNYPHALRAAQQLAETQATILVLFGHSKTAVRGPVRPRL